MPLINLSALHEQLTINELWTTDCNLVCSLEQENQMIARALFMFSIHSPDNVLMVLVSSLVPRPPPFFVLRFAFSIIHGSGRA